MSLDFNDLALQTIQSQYGASPHIMGLITAAATRLDPSSEIEVFYDKVFNPQTAEGIGLEIWGRIVGAERNLDVENEEVLGFKNSQLLPFNQGPWYKPGITTNYTLEDEGFRFLIFQKAAANIGNATLPKIKELLSMLFDDTVYVFNNGTMKVRVWFPFWLTKYQAAIMRNYGLFVLGAGVGFDYLQFPPAEIFGFDGQELQNFDNGTFWNGALQTPLEG